MKKSENEITEFQPTLFGTPHKQKIPGPERKWNKIILNYPKEEYEAFKLSLIKQLKVIVALLEKHKVRYRLDCGTLLGLYRNQDLIFPDFDNDLGICMNDLTVEFIQELDSLGMLRDRGNKMYYSKLEILKAIQTDTWSAPKIIKCIDPAADTRFFGNKIRPMTDLFLWVEHDGMMWSNLGSQNIMFHHIENILPLKVLNTKYGDFCIPINPEAYLADMYGDDWQIPNPLHKDRPGKVRGLGKREKTGDIQYNFAKKESRKIPFEPYIKPTKEEILRDYEESVYC